MMGIDADYALSRRYFSQGWPMFIVIDQEGVVRFHAFDSDRNLAALRRCVHELLAEQPAASGPNAALHGGIAFAPEALACRQAPRDRSPRLAFDPAGNPHVVYYSNRDGTNAVYVRRFNQEGAPAGDERLSPPNLDSYAADCAFGPDGTLWTVWCGRQSGFYDIYVQSRRPGSDPATQQLSFSDDDAMSPKLAVGPDGTVTATYYKWAFLWGYSRDRNIFARTWQPSRRAWSEEVEVSPHFPEVEDHTDPDAVVDRQGKSWIVWSYDYHPSLYKKPVDAQEPTIFAASVNSNTVSAPLLVGASGQFRSAIDLFPSAALDTQEALWCAWDCSEPQRCIRLSRLDTASNSFKFVAAFSLREGICTTPELSPATEGQLLLAWSQRLRTGPWQIALCLLKDGQAVGRTTLSEDADLLFPQAQRAPDGRYWLVYEHCSPKGSRIVLRNVTTELKRQPERAEQ